MLNYKCCTDVNIEKVYTGFKIGFSDYIIKMEISQEDFIKRFFGPEGNSLEYSFIALEDEEPVGVILSGIKNYEGLKTIRCGTLCVNPGYRGKGVSKELFSLHKQVALDNKCKQMFLEVIAGNERAIKFYNNLGYNKIYDISYYSLADTTCLREKRNTSVDIRKIDYDTILGISSRVEDVHINWQNDLDYVAKLEGITYYGAYENSELVGVLGINSIGKIYFIWTMLKYRHKGIAISLISNAVEDLRLQKLSISSSNNSKLEGFLRHIKFAKDKISQYEMYLTI
jgi:ribosomal protein S18 acetylase RimI-like enzyme